MSLREHREDRVLTARKTFLQIVQNNAHGKSKANEQSVSAETEQSSRSIARTSWLFPSTDIGLTHEGP